MPQITELPLEKYSCWTSEEQSLCEPLCIDLDGTLLNGNTLFEAVWFLLCRKPWMLLHVICWWARGQAHLWEQIVRYARLPVENLPYRPELIALAARESRYRDVVLVTGCHESVANRIASHLGYFSRVIATAGRIHMTGRTKTERLKQLYGAGGFDYVGDSLRSDGPVWRCARRAFVVGSKRTKAVPGVESIEVSSVSLPRAIWKGLRPHQWSKNALVMAALVTSHQFFRLELALRSALAMLLFCAAASCIYVLNDLLDIEADRRHATKRRRPVASGNLPIPVALALAGVLGAAAIAGAALLGAGFALIIALYMIASLAYSIWIKKLLIADVVVLTCLYVIRVFAGGIAAGIPISFWATAFALFFFFSLAAVKRYSELRKREGRQGSPNNRRAYREEDMSQFNLLGVSSGLISVCIVGLYIYGSDVLLLYRNPKLLWLLCPLLLYWCSRLWMLAGRGEVNEDPIVFALKDRPSYIVCGLMALTAIAASCPMPVL